MKRFTFAFFFLASINTIHADAPAPQPPQKAQEYTMELNTPAKESARQIRLQLELSEADVKDFGLNQAQIVNEISTRLALGQIQVKDDPALPKLVLRAKSIQADRAIATFVQLGFFEDAILKRNNTSIPALTWSQATLISGPKEDLSKEVDQVIITMINAFILDYHKAMSTQTP
jgi:hypothetical protein